MLPVHQTGRSGHAPLKGRLAGGWMLRATNSRTLLIGRNRRLRAGTSRPPPRCDSGAHRIAPAVNRRREAGQVALQTVPPPAAPALFLLGLVSVAGRKAIHCLVALALGLEVDAALGITLMTGQRACKLIAGIV